MFTQRPSQLSMYQADVEYLDRVGRDSFYGQVAQARARLFRDEDFADLYCPDNGRPAVPPSLVAVALLLQAHDKVSDEEAVSRANHDVRWCVALARTTGEKPDVFTAAHEFSRYFGSSLKAEAAINWDKKSERDALLRRIVSDAQRLLELARAMRAALPANTIEAEAIRQAAELLCLLLVQDIDGLDSDEPHLKDGVSKDRMPSATDPEMRHGRNCQRTSSTSTWKPTA